MRLTQEVIDDIRNSASISEVIGHYIPLTKKGKGYVANCPFHDDHDPSLKISEDKQIYRCFACGNGGNVFTFVMNYKKVPFKEAVKEVGDIIGKHIELDDAPKKTDPNEKYYEVFKAYLEETNYLLTATRSGEKALNYLKDRGLDEDIIEKFKIGYNPDDNFMYKYLSQKGFKDEDIVTIGLARFTSKGLSDIFYNRVIFPIYNRNGNPIALSARIIEKNDEVGKYINTAETKIYIKGDNLFNYHLARDFCRKLDNTIIVEGQMDVIALDRAEIYNVIAPLGTALTTNQISILKSLSNNVTLFYDGDRAGKAANIKNGQLLMENGFNVEVVENNTGLDPDEIINKGSRHALKDLVSKRIAYLDYAISYYKDQYNLDNYNDRKKFHLQISKMIDGLRDEYDKQNYYNILYDLTKIGRIESSNKSKKGYNNYRLKDFDYSIDGLTKAEYTILLMMTNSSDAKDDYKRNLGYLTEKTNQKLAMHIIDEYRKESKCNLSKIFDETTDDKEKELITTLSNIENIPDQYDKTLFLDAVNKVKEEIKLRKLNDLKKKVNELMTTDEKKANEYLSEYLKLLKELGGKTNGN